MRPAPTRWAAPSSRPRRSQKEITYDGSTYRQRSGLETYLIMGIDVKGKAVGVDSYEGGGQADVQMVLVVDDANKTWQVLQINRDTITKVPVLDVLGGVAAYADEQIALAHYYGNGRENSCENTALAVSMLLDDQPIDGYFALNMDAVGIVTDLVGGVTPDRHLGFLRDRPHAGAGRRGDAGRARRR